MRPLAPPTSPPRRPDSSAAPARPRTTGFSAIATPLPTRPPTDDDERDRRTHEERTRHGRRTNGIVEKCLRFLRLAKEEAPRNRLDFLSTMLSDPRPSFYLYLGGFFSLRARCEEAALGRKRSYRFSLSVPVKPTTTQVIA